MIFVLKDFLKQWLLKNVNFNILDLHTDISVDDFYKKEEVLALLTDSKFLESWQSNEYKIINNQVSKWK